MRKWTVVARDVRWCGALYVCVRMIKVDILYTGHIVNLFSSLFSILL